MKPQMKADEHRWEGIGASIHGNVDRERAVMMAEKNKSGRKKTKANSSPSFRLLWFFAAHHCPFFGVHHFKSRV
jgi:hypothetical protein